MTARTDSDRGDRGRFKVGNAGGPGNPNNAAISRLRRALHQAVTEDDIQEVIEVLVAKAKEGNLPAIRERLDRAIGKSTDANLAERLDELERAAAELNGRFGGTPS